MTAPRDPQAEIYGSPLYPKPSQTKEDACMDLQLKQRKHKPKFHLKDLLFRNGLLRPTLRVILTLALSLMSASIFSMLFGLVILLLPGRTTVTYTTIFNLAYIGQGLGVILAVAIARKYLDRRRVIDLGLRPGPAALPDFVFGLILGAGLQLLIFLVHFFCGWITIRLPSFTPHGIPVPGIPAPSIPTPAPPAATLVALALMLLIFTLVAVNEELLVRGYILQNLTEAYGKSKAALASALLFGAMHLTNANASLAGVLNITLSGIFFAAAYWATKSLYLPIGLHLSWNFFLGPVFGFPVSGFSYWPSIISTTVIGPELWTGGAFGPEAGLTGLFAILVGTLIVGAWADWRNNWIPSSRRSQTSRRSPASRRIPALPRRPL